MIGIHLNYIPGAYERDPGSRPLTAAERSFLAARDAWVESEGAYWHLHATRPQTLAYALNDSPVGLAAWIVEKYRSWSDCNGDVERRFTKDEMLANISLYWFTETIGSSVRYYHEGRHTARSYKDLDPMTVPAGVAVFPREEPMPPREYAARFYNVVRWTEQPAGGHFAAMEEPRALAGEVRAFFRQVRRNGM